MNHSSQSRNITSRSRRRGGKQKSVFSPAQKQEISRLTARRLAREEELKYTQAGATLTPSTANFTLTRLTDTPQGVTDTNRIGDILNLKSLKIKLDCVRNPATANVVEYIRFVIFQWFPQSSVVPPTGANLFLNDPVAGAVNYRSFWIVDGIDQIRILHDEVITMTGLTATTEGALDISGTISLAQAKKKVLFVAGSTTDAFQHLYLGLCSSTATTAPTITWSTITRFTDG